MLPNMKRELIELIEPCGEEISEEVAAAILARGHEAVPGLIELLEDDELAPADSQGEGYLPIHAAWLLAKLKSVEAIEPMLRVLARCDPLEILFSELVHQLKALGPPVLEPALAQWARAGTDEAREGIENVLAGIGVRDDRILRALLARLDADRTLGAALLGQYGDPAALPRLSAALDAAPLDENAGLIGNAAIAELDAAITDLGGTLSESQERKVQPLWDFEANRAIPAIPARDAPSEPRSWDPDRRKKAKRKQKKKAQRRNRR